MTAHLKLLVLQGVMRPNLVSDHESKHCKAHNDASERPPMLLALAFAVCAPTAILRQRWTLNDEVCETRRRGKHKIKYIYMRSEQGGERSVHLDSIISRAEVLMVGETITPVFPRDHLSAGFSLGSPR